MMKNRLSKFVKVKRNNTAKKKKSYNLVNIITILAIFLCLSFLVIFLQSLQIQSLEGKHTALVNTYNSLSGGLTNIISELRNTRDENSTLDRKNLSLREQVDLYEADVIAYQVKIDECNNKIIELTTELELLKTEEAKNADLIANLEAEIVRYQEAAEAFDDPLSLASLPITSESYLFRGTKWNIIENYTSRKSGSTYTTTQFLVDPSNYYAVYAPGTVSILCYTKEYSLIKTLKEDASEGWFVTFDSNVAYVSVKYTDASTIFVSTGISVKNPTTPEKGRAFYVVSPNSPVKLSISKAVNMLTGNGTVLILPGTYTENVSAVSKKINLVGVGASKCKLVSTDMDYMNPPLEIAAGTVKGLTIHAKNKGGKVTDKKAYAVHCDYDYCTNRGVTISDCDLISDFNAALGLGTRPGTITVSNCNLTGLTCGVFFHDAGRDDLKGKQTFKLISCNVKSEQGKYAIAVQSLDRETTEMLLIFKNNKFSNGDGTTPELMEIASTNDHDGWNGFLGYTLDKSSTGNNMDIFNSK